jgi:hypothetical protein
LHCKQQTYHKEFEGDKSRRKCKEYASVGVTKEKFPKRGAEGFRAQPRNVIKARQIGGYRTEILKAISMGASRLIKRTSKLVRD